MTHILKFIIVFIILTFASCKAQEIKISVNDEHKTENLKLTVFLLTNNDSLILKDIRPGFYTIKQSKNNFLISYRNKKYLLKNIEDTIKSIIIYYNPNAENDCYVINKIFEDAIQSYNSKDFKDCSDVSNIYLYNTFEHTSIKLPKVRLRKKE